MDQNLFYISDYRLRRVQSGHDGPNWLFLPGGPGLGSQYWESLIEVVTLHGSIFLVDYPGDGDNPTPLRPMHWKSGLLDVVRKMERVHLVAHSFGAMFVMTIPEIEDYLDSLVLMSGSPKRLTHHHPGPSDLKVEFPQSLCRYVTPEYLKEARKRFHDLPYSDQAFVWVRDQFHPHFYPTFVPSKVPTLILTGELDQITPMDNYQKTPYLHTEEVVVHKLKGASHFPWFESPDEVNRWLQLMSEPVLVTKRLLLRQLNAMDQSLLSELVKEPQLLTFSCNKPHGYLLNPIIDHYVKWGFGRWGVFRKEDGKFLGLAGLQKHDLNNGTQAELTYCFFTQYEKKGYELEAAKAICDVSFSRFNLSQIIASIDCSNRRGLYAAQKLGMMKEKQINDEGIECCIYSLRNAG